MKECISAWGRCGWRFVLVWGRCGGLYWCAGDAADASLFTTFTQTERHFNSDLNSETKAEQLLVASLGSFSLRRFDFIECMYFSELGCVAGSIIYG